jgi:hypothetical protein
MTLRIQFAIGVALAAIILPIIIVRAQAEGEAQVPTAEETVVVEEPTTEATVPQEEGALTNAPAESPSAEGEVLGESDTVAEQTTVPMEPAATTSETEGFVGSTASSTEATSTPPVEEPKPIEEPFVLQPGVALSINGNSVSAAITLDNLTCKSRDKVLPELEVLVYYTEWYPNDGPLSDYSAASVHSAKQSRSVADLPNGASRDLTWSAEVPSGHYYFVVEVDPQNTNGAYGLYRSEFSI